MQQVQIVSYNSHLLSIYNITTMMIMKKIKDEKIEKITN